MKGNLHIGDKIYRIRSKELSTIAKASYQEEHKNIINSLKSLIEPIMIIFLAIVVGGVVLSVIIPMFSLYGQIS